MAQQSAPGIIEVDPGEILEVDPGEVTAATATPTPPEEGYWTGPTGEKVLQSEVTIGSPIATRIAKEGRSWRWTPPPSASSPDAPGGTVARVWRDPSKTAPALDVMPQDLLMTGRIGYGVGKAAIGAAPGMVSRAGAVVRETAPIIKYEIGTQVLRKMGVPPVYAELISAYMFGRPSRHGGAAAPPAAEAPPTAPAPPPVPTGRRWSGGTVTAGGPTTLEATLEQELRGMTSQPAVPGRVTAPVPPGAVMTPGGRPSAGPMPMSPGVPVTPAAPVAAPAAAAPAAAPVAAPVPTAGPVAAPPPTAAPTPRIKLSAPEVNAYHEARRGGLSHDDTIKLIEVQREFLTKTGLAGVAPPAVSAAPAAPATAPTEPLGTPRVLSWKEGRGPTAAEAKRMSEEFGSREAARRLRTTQTQVQQLRGPSVSALPASRRSIIDAKLATLKDPLEIAAYLKAAPNDVTRAYVRFKLGIPD